MRGASVDATAAHEQASAARKRWRLTTRDCTTNTAAVTVAFAIDTAAPVIRIAGVTDGQCSASALAPTVSATDAHLVSVTGSLDGAPFVSGTPVTDEGDHVLVVTAVVTAAAHVATTSAGFTLDATAPVISILGVTDTELVTAPPAPVIDIDDPNLISAELRLDGLPYV